MRQYKVITSCVTAYVIAFLIWGIPSGIFLAGIVRNWGAPGTLQGLLLIAIFGLVLFSWLLSVKVIVRDDGIEYREMFKGNIFIGYSNIDSTKRIESLDRRNSGNVLRLVIADNLSRRKILINTKLLDRRDVNFIRSVIAEKTGGLENQGGISSVIFKND